jgi:hypothetical protein
LNPPSPAQEARPAWATALGLLGIVIAVTHSVEIVDEMASLLSFLMTSPTAASQPAVRGSLGTAYILTAVVRIGVTVILLAAAILLLKRRKAARRLFILYLVLIAASYLLLFYNKVFYALHGGATAGAGSILLSCFLAVLEPYPIFYLIWFFRPTIAKEMASWR